MNHFLAGLWHATKSGLYTTTGDGQFSRWTEKLQSTSQNQTRTQKRSWPLLGDLLLVWSTRIVWISAKPLHLRHAQQTDKMHWKLQCLQMVLVNRKGPALLYDNAWPHVAQAVLRSFASPTIFTWPLAKWVALFQASWQHFCRENTSITSRMQKTLSKFVGSRSMDFYATGINKHLLSAKT